ncbi:hypothetical protein WA026_009635 [Henosepilachna vigintioctopunctata]|uniref:Uncharacterized protein n=1 Tax=Henosepilachna vigintioctopunctata TaxID=420089 RepID=A0AAW1U4F0_9CUCU
MQSLMPTMDRYLEYVSVFSIILLSTALAGCPSKCICSKNKVKCVEKSLFSVPNFESLENEPDIIDISSNEIDYIQNFDFSFDKAKYVMILYLNDSKIIDIDDTAFKELINLREMYLSNNLLSDLPKNAFKYNKNLISLDLSHNLFRNMPKIISHSLKTLNLINSGIVNIEEDRFIDLPDIEYLYLQRNNIRIIHVDMFKYLPKLIVVELQYNAWKCTCETVEMFNYLSANSLVNIEEPFQCKTKNDFFITFFDNFGTKEPIKNLCLNNAHNTSYNFGGESEEIEEMEVDQEKLTKMLKGIIIEG